VHPAARERRRERLDESPGQRESRGVVACLPDEREADRQRERTVHEGEPDDDRQDHPVVAIADFGLAHR